MTAKQLIGQAELLTILGTQIEHNKLPSSVIIYGPRGSGKKTLVRVLIEKTKAISVFPGTKVNDIKECISRCRNSSFPIACVIDNAEELSMSARNVLLKTLEAPPKQLRFFLLYTDINSCPDTIKSRCACYRMDRYTPDEIIHYAQSTYHDISSGDLAIIADVCDVPGEVDILVNSGVNKLYEFVELVIDNIAVVSEANALKISTSIDLKDDDPGKYNLALFWKLFICCCLNRAISNEKHYLQWVNITDDWARYLPGKGFNKQSLFDVWVMDIRRVVLE